MEFSFLLFLHAYNKTHRFQTDAKVKVKDTAPHQLHGNNRDLVVTDGADNKEEEGGGKRMG